MKDTTDPSLLKVKYNHALYGDYPPTDCMCCSILIYANIHGLGDISNLEKAELSMPSVTSPFDHTFCELNVVLREAFIPETSVVRFK